MNESKPDYENLEDRLLKQALGELLGGQRPPDLSQRIMDATKTVQPPKKVSWRPWAKYALAASLLVSVAAALMLPAVQTARESARESAALSQAATSESSTPADSYGDLDDVIRFENEGLRYQTPPASTPQSGATSFSQEGQRVALSRKPIPKTPFDPAVVAERPFQTFGRPEAGGIPGGEMSGGGMGRGGEGGFGGGMGMGGAIGGEGPVAGSKVADELRAAARPTPASLASESEAKQVAAPAYAAPSAAGLPGLAAPAPQTSGQAGQAPPAMPIQSPVPQQFDQFGNPIGLGQGPSQAGDRYSRIVENPFLAVTDNPLSTFSIDVDTASYSKTRRYLMENNTLPPPDAVRIEELVNYFSYDYSPPTDNVPFAAHVEVAACPWKPEHRLVRVGLKGKEIAADKRPASNLVFLLDVSGSMRPDDRLPRVIRSMRMLVEQLGENDRVAIVVYAGASGLVLPSTGGYDKEKILASLESLQAGGSTNGGSGILLAYDAALANFIRGGTNRVILCTDGDFNVGTTSTGDLQRLAEEKAKTGVFLTVLGFGMGNHNDDMLEKLADKGNGNYGYIDTEEEARKLLVEQLGGTLVTIAKDVKIQIEFNPQQVAAYRLIGYENRMLRAEDFNDDTKDAGEIGAGHTVTALYEIAPPTAKPATPKVDALKYQQQLEKTEAAASNELLTLKLRYKDPDGQESHEPLVFPVSDSGHAFGQATGDFKFAAAVAGFGMLLRQSAYKGDVTYDAVLEIAQESLGADKHGYRAGFIELVRKAKAVAKGQ